MNRRKFIHGTGGLVLAGQTTGVMGKTEDKSELAYPSQECRGTRRTTPGPYLTPNSPLRSDIREASAGVPLQLEFTVLDDQWCKPAADAIVDIWHCDARGMYSNVQNVEFDRRTLLITDRAVDMRDKTFLRGHQVTDAQGKARFTTIFPGWYMPRLLHIHVRVVWRGIEWTALDTQLFLPADIERAVFARAPYAERGPNPIDTNRDILMKGDTKAVQELTIPLAQDSDGFTGSFELATIALDV